MSTISNDVKARVLSAVSAIDPIVTNATNRTANFELPLFVGSDKPAWLVDWNNTMVAIDTLLKQVDSVGTDNTTAISQLSTKLADLEKVVQTAQSDITANSDNIAENAKNITDLTNSLNTVQDDLISQNSVIKTHTTQIADLQSTDEVQNTEITNLKNADTELSNRITNYIASKNGFTYNPSVSIRSVNVPDPSMADVQLSLDSRVIPGEDGVKSRYGLLFITFQKSSADGVLNGNVAPIILGFTANFESTKYGFLDGSKTKTIYGGDGSSSYGHFEITMYLTQNDIQFNIEALKGLSAKQGTFNVLGVLI